jgi:hypothetical protein
VEREISTPVDIADAEGRLRREALGWARHPIQRCNLRRGVSRFERFNYWCIYGRTQALTLLFADLGYFGAVLVSFLDYAAGKPVERVYVRPGGLPFEMPAEPRGDVAIDVRRLRLSMRTRGEEMRVEGEARTLFGKRITIDLTVTRPHAHETVNLVVPWDDTRYHFTSKQQALPARGTVRTGDREYHYDDQSFACLDFGRGRWPSRIAWNWAFGAFSDGKHTIGFNLGGKWTDGTGVTENAIVIDGRVHKIADAVSFDGNRIRGARVDLRFDPICERKVKAPPLVGLHQMMGRFSGRIDEVKLENVIGLAESFNLRL